MLSYMAHALGYGPRTASERLRVARAPVFSIDPVFVCGKDGRA